MAKVIGLFNHKGGVSKTTTAFNLGWSLANLNKKVLLVDLDSQCNSTGLILGYAGLSDGLDSFYSSRDNLTLMPIVDRIIDGETPEGILDAEKGRLHQTQNENLFLLPGSLNISSLDSQISIALKIAAGVPATRNLPGALPQLVKSLARDRGFDYVILDMSPNVGGLNEVMLMSSDYFIVPTTPDFFCWQAVSSLTKYIEIWHSDLSAFKAASATPRAVASLSNCPLFLGTIQQRYRIRKREPAKSFEKWITAIRDSVDASLVPCLTRLGCVKNRADVQVALDALGLNLQAYDLAHISDFNSLIAISQNLGRPVFALTDEDLKNAKQFGWALETMKESRTAFSDQFKILGELIISLTS